MAAFAGSLLVFPTVATTAGAVGYAALLGVAGGLVTVVYFAVYGSAFGRSSLGLIQAAAQVVTVFASAAGPVLLTECKDVFGSYDPLFFVAGALALGLGLSAWKTALPRDGSVPSPLGGRVRVGGEPHESGDQSSLTG